MALMNYPATLIIVPATGSRGFTVKVRRQAILA
jgi:hypothetical protein